MFVLENHITQDSIKNKRIGLSNTKMASQKHIIIKI